MGMDLKRMAYRLGCTLVAWVGGGLVLGLGPGHALDFAALSPDGQPSAFLPLPTPTREADSFEARFGVFAHSVGATEAGGVDARKSFFCPLRYGLTYLPGMSRASWPSECSLR